MKARSTRIAVMAAAVIVVIALVWVVVDHTSGKSSSSATPTTVAGSHSRSDASVTGPTVPPSSSTTTGNHVTTTTLQPIPLQVSATSGKGLRDGQSMTVTVTADKGSQFYGMDARLCAGSPAIADFYDYTPDPAGNCILKPLSGDSDAFLEAAVGPPHEKGTLTFRVGVGTSSFRTENLQNVSITCGPGHPCQLVVRLQYPYGFGFRSFPVTYAG